MRVLQINIFGNLSTGRIAVDLYRTLEKHGCEGTIAYARNTIPDDVKNIKIGNKFSVYSDVIRTRITDKAGFFSKSATKSLIEWISEYNPDIVHLHNVHGYYINVELLFDYLKEKGLPVVWTLHDCWAFTGHCCNFEHIGCERWKTACEKCPQKKTYPASLFVDNSANNYLRKRQLFTGLDKMVLVTPSSWLNNLLKQSYMRDYPIEVIHNGVDKSVFKPTVGNWKQNHHLDKKRSYWVLLEHGRKQKD